jgi:hypothetical protein
MSDEPKDPQVSQRYRELGKDEPRPETDAAILAAARRAAKARPAPLVAPSGRQRWYFPLAAAAVIALAVAVTLHIEREKPSLEDSNIAAIPPAPPQAAKDDPEPKAPLQEAVPMKPAPAQRAAPKAPRVGNRAEEKREQAPTPPTSPPADEVRERQAEPLAKRAPAPAARSDAQAGVQPFSLAESPQRWLERIAELRKQGRDEEADKQLAEFRKRFPDYRIPESMLEKIEKK